MFVEKYLHIGLHFGLLYAIVTHEILLIGGVQAMARPHMNTSKGRKHKAAPVYDSTLKALKHHLDQFWKMLQKSITIFPEDKVRVEESGNSDKCLHICMPIDNILKKIYYFMKISFIKEK